MENSKWTFLQSFTPQFQSIGSELEQKIGAAKLASSPTPESLQEISVLLSKAAKTLADATGSIPAYDQKQCETQLKTFEKAVESLRATTAPKSKFAFKRKAAVPASSAIAAPAAPTVEAEQVKSQYIPDVTPTSTSNHLVLSSHSHKYITRADLPPHSQKTDLSIFDLDNCVVDLLPPVTNGPDGHIDVSALHARNLTKCVILLPIVEGSALLHDLTNCVIVLGCHQFRMHSSKGIDVLLSISSNPIIEHCNGIRFAHYPAIFKTPSEKPNPVISVQDFSHIRATPSPNHSALNEEDRVRLEEKLAILHRDRRSLAETEEILPMRGSL